MFSRLLKHEWKASAGLLGILSLAAFGIGIAATVVLRVLVNFEGNLSLFDRGADPLEILATTAMGIFLFFSIIALSVYVIAVQFILLYRFYKNKYTDEGYLTFTLPVKTHEIFWSSFVNMLLWVLIAAAVVLAILCMVLLFGTSTEGLINTEVFKGLSEFFEIFSDVTWEEIFEEGETLYVVLMVLQLLVTPFYALFVPMCCITMGAVLAKKHKILASFGMYYVVNFVVGIITSVATVVPSLFLLSNGSEDIYFLVSAGIEVLTTVALTLASYFLTIHLMKRKLNLP